MTDPIVCHRHVGRDPYCAICTPMAKKNPPPTAPTDREAALLAEVALLREACVEQIPMNYGPARLICRLCGWSNRGAGPDWHEPSCILAQPPGAAGQAVLAAGDALTMRLAERDLTTHCMQFHGRPPSVCDDNRCRTGREARAAWWQARAGSSSGGAEGGEAG